MGVTFNNTTNSQHKGLGFVTVSTSHEWGRLHCNSGMNELSEIVLVMDGELLVNSLQGSCFGACAFLP